MTPRCLLVGHTAPVLCISKASIIQDNNYIVSSSEAGEMCTWDLVDGKCREFVKLPQVHTNMQVTNIFHTYYALVMLFDYFWYFFDFRHIICVIVKTCDYFATVTIQK